MVITRSTGLCALVLALLFVPAAAPSRSALPQRIVSLSPTATEDLFAIGAGKQVIAVDNQSNYPANAPKTKLSGYTPNAEAIAAYKPDLVVAVLRREPFVEALGKLHIRRARAAERRRTSPGLRADSMQLGTHDRTHRRRGERRCTDEGCRSRRS